LHNTVAQPFADTSLQPSVRGFLHIPENPNGSGVVLTHGAGGNAQAPLLIALADTFCAAGFTVLRCDLPFRQVRSWGPPGPGDAAHDREGLKNAIVALKKIVGAPVLADDARTGNPSVKNSSQIFLGGHSYGGRQSSMLCAEEPDIVDGLLLLSYPLHPPRKPEQQRTQHLPNLRTPALFVHGTRDPFGSIEELEQAIKMIPGRTQLLVAEGAGHDLGFKGKARREGLPGEVLRVFTEFIALSS
jgi:predicted alpha/beta-hydrolase family hydrolase